MAGGGLTAENAGMDTLHEDQLGRLLCGYVATSDEAIFVVAAEDDGLEAAPIVYSNGGFGASNSSKSYLRTRFSSSPISSGGGTGCSSVAGSR